MELSSALVDFRPSTEDACFAVDKAFLAEETPLHCTLSVRLSESTETCCKVEEAAISPVWEEVNLQ